jgi:hypothetical protein
MGPLRTVGLVLAVASSVVWLLVAGLLVVPPGGSVPLRVVGLYALAVPASIAAAVVQAVVLRRARTPARRAAVALAAASAVLLPCIPLLGSADALPGAVLRGLFFLGVGAFVVSTVLFARPARDVGP